ncbi:GNAT family N-acetyltransferase [Myxococcus sp. K15C18031901]|uniref:GNAT family N-acetyltransferase n=1 Tax=Myxococcus dinghuensis TaxID=2906761 RepID=UPI0020A711B3|nr:GNAT family N-acetyltransferase [Myxococcus dinghuensis]MCP3102659.1 GNAT family N-acetyltransferase [Myxococcus dinghuensis]
MRSTQPRVIRVGPGDTALQEAFCGYVPQVFRTVDFRRWCAWGEWTDAYHAYCVFDDGQVVANASVTRMHLRVEGRDVLGYQLGAVGCIPSHRGRGLARLVMEAALDDCGAAPVVLFANKNVLGLYPRFGFVPRRQSLFGVSLTVEPGGEAAPVLDLTDGAVRARLHAWEETAAPVTERFGAWRHARIASWYAAADFARPLRRLSDDAWVFAGVEDGTLYVDDLFAREPFDLRPHLSRLVDAPVTSIQFGFTPERWWPEARELGEDTEADLFVRGLSLPDGPDRFPVMART